MPFFPTFLLFESEWEALFWKKKENISPSFPNTQIYQNRHNYNSPYFTILSWFSKSVKQVLDNKKKKEALLYKNLAWSISSMIKLLNEGMSSLSFPLLSCCVPYLCVSLNTFPTMRGVCVSISLLDLPIPLRITAWNTKELSCYWFLQECEGEVWLRPVFSNKLTL